MKSRKTVLFILALILLFPLFSGYVSISIAQEQESIQAQLTSYDYSEGWNWGQSYRSWWDEYEGVPYPIDVDYVGMSAEDQQSLTEEPEKWRKYWLRVEITPASDVKGTGMPIYGRTMEIDNVRILNCEDVMIFPKNTMLMSADYYRIRENEWEDKILDSEYEVRFEPTEATAAQNAYWAEFADKNSNEWYLEAVAFVDDRMDEEMEKRFEKANIVFNATVTESSQDGKYVKVYGAEQDTQDFLPWMYIPETGQQTEKIVYENVPLHAQKAEREVRYTAGGYYAWAELYGQLIDDADKVLASLRAPNSVHQAMKQSPEKYTVYFLAINVEKAMPWGACCLRYSIQSETDEIWVLGDTEIHQSSDEQWQNGRYEGSGTDFVIYIAGKTDEQIKRELQAAKVTVEISTEYAGYSLWARYMSAGYPGPRFTVEVDMSKVMSIEELPPPYNPENEEPAP